MFGWFVFTACNDVVIEKLTKDSGVVDDEVVSEDTWVEDDTAVAADTGDVIEGVSGCAALELLSTETEEPTGEYVLGSFRLWVAGQGIEVRSQKQPDHLVFESFGEDWLRVGHSDVEVEEHQGSFHLEEYESYTCSEFRVSGARYGQEALVLEGRFEDDGIHCSDVSFQLSVCELSEDRLSFSFATDSDEISFVSLSARSSEDDRIYGMGEQFPHDTLNLKGREIPVLVQEGGVGRGHSVISPVVNQVSSGSAGSEDTTYFVMPQYITSALQSLFLKETAYSEFDFQPEFTDIRVHNGTVSWEVLYGESPLNLISRFTEYSGRMPVPPKWLDNGAIIALARDLPESTEIVEELLANGTQIAAIWNQTWSGINETFIGEQVLWNWHQNQTSHPDWNSWTEQLNERDIKVLCYVNSMFLDVTDHETRPDRNLFQEGEQNEYFVKDLDGETLLIPVTAFDVSLLDLTNPEAREWMKSVIFEEMVDKAGCAGWMVDFAEALPFAVELHDGTDAALYHNQYPVEWMKLNREVVEENGLLGEILTFNRSGFTTSPSHSLMVWEGDQLTTWDKYDGMTSALRGLLNGGFSGIALNHSDTGGYTSLSRWGLGYSRSHQLMRRWTEMNAFTSVLRTHEGNQPQANAQVYSDDDSQRHFARMSRVYRALGFYRRGLFEEANAYGWPVVRHLWMHYPNDEIAENQHDEFLLGSEILVAPILTPCLVIWNCNPDREVYLPEDEWMDLWTGAEYSGGQSIVVNSALGYPPVFYRKHSPIAEELLTNLRAAGIDVHD